MIFSSILCHGLREFVVLWFVIVSRLGTILYSCDFKAFVSNLKQNYSVTLKVSGIITNIPDFLLRILYINKGIASASTNFSNYIILMMTHIFSEFHFAILLL